MKLDFANLNPNQLKSVNWEEGPLLVLAGPGSGKTRVLTYRIARIIEATKDKRFRILGLTFTNKAASEMRERIESLVPESSERTLLTTFHSYCADILRQHGHHLGIKPDFTILSQKEDQEALMKDVLRTITLDDFEFDFKASQVLPIIARLSDKTISYDAAETVLSEMGVEDTKSVAHIYQAYRSELIKRNALDFPALVHETINLLESKPGIRRQIRMIYPYVCVDEFQDTNLSQYKVLRLLVKPENPNLFVVADDDQIIYQWNGASPERLFHLRDEFKMTTIQLPENYRCPPEVILLANNLIKFNEDRPPEKEDLVAHKVSESDNVIRIKQLPFIESETDWVAKDILQRSKEVHPDCVILARTRKLLDFAMDALSGNGLEGYLAIRKDEFESAPLCWMHAILRLTNSRQDKENLRKACKAFYKLDGINIRVEDVIAKAALYDNDYLRGWRNTVMERTELSPGARKIIDKFIKLLDEKLAFWNFISESKTWFEEIISETQYPEGTMDVYHEEIEVWENIVNDILGKYGKDDVSLNLILQEFDLRSKQPLPGKNAIPCLTIHSAKGMEFKHVYLIGMVDDVIPSFAAKKKGDNSHEMREERRNCFVAITRAEESLTMTLSKKMYGYPKNPSRYFREMGLME